MPKACRLNRRTSGATGGPAIARRRSTLRVRSARKHSTGFVKTPSGCQLKSLRWTRMISAKAAEQKMSQKSVHVVPRGGKWAVRSSGAAKASKIVNTQDEAREIAREQAKRSGVELYVHGRNGRIRERNSYGKDPYPPKG
ncbi:MAG: DUF2188 domain-containing protein [Roseovarius sp.]